MNKIILLCVCVMFLSQSATGQKINIDRSQELKIGDLMPDTKSFPILNYEKKGYRYTNGNPKVTIFDFFDTKCAGCIANMPRLSRIQEELGDQVEIILVTYESPELIDRFFKKNKFLKENKSALPTIVADKDLRKLFPHHAISHTVWVYNGKVQAISHPDFVNVKNLKKLISTGSIDIPLKDDFLQVEMVQGESDPIMAMSFIGHTNVTSYNPTLSAKSITFESDSLGNTIYFNNMEILGAFTAAWSILKSPTYILTKDRIEWNLSDPDRYHFDEGKGVSYREWEITNAICYKRVDWKDYSELEKARLVLHDLSSFLGVTVSWEMRKKKCLVIKTSGKSQSEPIGEGSLVKGTDLLAFQMDLSGRYLPVVDDAKDMRDLIIPTFRNTIELNKYLKSYGLKIEEEEREIEVLVFRE